MIIYLHGFDATSPGNHEKVLQLKFIDPDVRAVTYSTLHPRHDLSHLLKEVQRNLESSTDACPLICGVGLGGYWSERIGFLAGIKSVLFNPNLHPELNMVGRIDRPEEYADIASKCVSEFRTKNRARSLVILSRNDETTDQQPTANALDPYYEVVWDETQGHKFKQIAQHLQRIKAFKLAPVTA
ncbi:MAG: alpha/beta hydrolase [Gammaproteobacteria bacterium]|nr:alpha/beta hydrolase [Gammaproteobacteria bacterium]